MGRTRSAASQKGRERIEQLLGGCGGITLVPPCSQRELAARMRDCDLMLSDSGGVQEEAPALGVPLMAPALESDKPVGSVTTSTRSAPFSTPRLRSQKASRLSAIPACAWCAACWPC